MQSVIEESCSVVAAFYCAHELRKAASDYLDHFFAENVRSHVWYNEPPVYEAALPISSGTADGSFGIVLVGTVKCAFGDVLSDEYVVAEAAWKATTELPYAYATLRDNDGEFLLCDCADFLPSWLEPNVAANRVWLQRGRLLLIPPSVTFEHIATDLDAVNYIASALGRSDCPENPFDAGSEINTALDHIIKKKNQEARMKKKAKYCVPQAIADLLKKFSQIAALSVHALAQNGTRLHVRATCRQALGLDDGLPVSPIIPQERKVIELELPRTVYARLRYVTGGISRLEKTEECTKCKNNEISHLLGNKLYLGLSALCDPGNPEGSQRWNYNIPSKLSPVQNNESGDKSLRIRDVVRSLHEKLAASSTIEDTENDKSDTSESEVNSKDDEEPWIYGDTLNINEKVGESDEEQESDAFVKFLEAENGYEGIKRSNDSDSKSNIHKKKENDIWAKDASDDESDCSSDSYTLFSMKELVNILSTKNNSSASEDDNESASSDESDLYVGADDFGLPSEYEYSSGSEDYEVS